MPETRRSNVGELAGLAIEQDLIKHCCITKESIDLTIRELKLKLPSADAHSFLRILISGAVSGRGEQSVHPTPEQEPAQEQPPKPEPEASRPTMIIGSAEARGEQETEAADAYQKRELFRAPSVITAAENRTSATGPEGVGGDGGAAYQESAVSEEYLDSVLSFALTMGIIEGYTKDRESHTVTLRMGATTTGLSYWETLEYLTNSMLYELRPKSES